MMKMKTLKITLLSLGRFLCIMWTLEKGLNDFIAAVCIKTLSH